MNRFKYKAKLIAISDGYIKNVEIRDTQRHWITVNGTRFSKRDGDAIAKYPIYRLDLSSIQEIEQ